MKQKMQEHILAIISLTISTLLLALLCQSAPIDETLETLEEKSATVELEITKVSVGCEGSRPLEGGEDRFKGFLDETKGLDQNSNQAKVQHLAHLVGLRPVSETRNEVLSQLLQKTLPKTVDETVVEFSVETLTKGDEKLVEWPTDTVVLQRTRKSSAYKLLGTVRTDGNILVLKPKDVLGIYNWCKKTGSLVEKYQWPELVVASGRIAENQPADMKEIKPHHYSYVAELLRPNPMDTENTKFLVRATESTTTNNTAYAILRFNVPVISMEPPTAQENWLIVVGALLLPLFGTTTMQERSELFFGASTMCYGFHRMKRAPPKAEAKQHLFSTFFKSYKC